MNLAENYRGLKLRLFVVSFLWYEGFNNKQKTLQHDTLKVVMGIIDTDFWKCMFPLYVFDKKRDQEKKNGTEKDHF